MILIQQVNEAIEESDKFISLLEGFENDLASGAEITNENLIGVLDRMKYAASKKFLPDPEKETIARVLTALTWIKHNLNDPEKSEHLRDLIDAPMATEKDFVAAVDKMAPGVLKKMGPKAFMQTIFQDIGAGGEKTREAIANVSTLRTQDFDNATRGEQVRKQVAPGSGSAQMKAAQQTPQPRVAGQQAR